MMGRSERLLGAWVALCLAACAAGGHASGRVEPSPAALLQEGVRLSHAGQWVRAEQYLVAAQQAGAPRDRVLPLLLRVCVRSGQQRRALDHVQHALRRAPSDVQLWVLGGALAWAAGDLPLARRHLSAAQSMPGAPAEVAYWQARVAITAGEPLHAAERLRTYLGRAPGGAFAAWARFWLARDDRGAT